MEEKRWRVKDRKGILRVGSLRQQEPGDLEP